MKTPEDEAFDELAKRQGMWGGGFNAKRQAAMDKINSDFDEEYIKYRDAFPKGYLAPQQEPVAFKHMMLWVHYLKRPSDFGQHMNIPSGFSAGDCWELANELERFIKNQLKREWVGLTDDERNKILMSDKPSWERHIAEEIEAKLKEKNFD
jgi:hypothetical protein